jgi:hypothetical protein
LPHNGIEDVNPRAKRARKRKLRGSAAPAEQKRRHSYRRKAVGAENLKNEFISSDGDGLVFFAE